MSGFSESVVDDAALAWIEALGYAPLRDPDIAAERSDPNYRGVLLERRLRQAHVRLSRDLPLEALEQTFRKFGRLGWFSGPGSTFRVGGLNAVSISQGA